MTTNRIVSAYEPRSKLIKANSQVFSITLLTYRIKRAINWENILLHQFSRMFQKPRLIFHSREKRRKKKENRIRNSYNIWTEYIAIGSFWFCVSPQALTGRRQQIHELFPENPREEGVCLTELYLWQGAVLIITFTGDAVKRLVIHSFCRISAGQLNPALFDTMHRTSAQSIIACLHTTV